LAANLNIHLHCLVLDGVYRRGIDGAPEFVEVPEPTDEALQAALVVPQAAEAPAQAATPAECDANCAHHRAVRLSWAKLLKPVIE
jgi:hypothetical protein